MAAARAAARDSPRGRRALRGADVEPRRLVEAFRGALYETALIGAVPGLLRDAAAGEVELAAAAFAARVPTAERFSHGLYLSVECQESFAFADAAAVQASIEDDPRLAHLALTDGPWAEACAAWDVGAAPAATHAPVESDVPVLVLAGELDPVTPLPWGEAIAAHLTTAFVLEAPGMGHDVTASACPRELRNAFFEDPSRAPSLPCFDALEAPAWLVP